ncbi:MAG TPA: FHA domain-containing protein [Blastocatellia bacterium]|nr:FHA domain-containing protein [Blastocatellia bacterium]
MIELIFTKGPLSGVRFAIEGDSVSIGRLSECDIELNQPNVSRKHAFIKRIGEGLQIIDNNSGNGTFVNGRRVRSAELRSGDEIRIGSNTLQVDVAAGRLTSSEIETAKVRAAARATRVDRISHFVVEDRSGDNLRTMDFSCENLTVGRGDKCRLVLDDSEVSRLHATIHHQSGGFTIKDAGSANGTLLNGERIVEARLHAGDRVEMGNMVIEAGISDGILRLVITRNSAANTAGGSGNNSAASSGSSPSAQAYIKTTPEVARSARSAARRARRPDPPPAAPQTGGQTRARGKSLPYPVVRTLVMVIAVAVLLFIVGRAYAAPVLGAWQK